MPNHVTANGVRTWYDERGSGEPLVLLHGGFSDSRDFATNLAGLAAEFRVLMPERRGHGHTPDVPGPVTLEALADDVTEFLAAVAGGPAHLVGYSAGGVVAAMVSLRRPDLVRRLGLVSTAVSADGWLFQPRAGAEMPAPIVDAYAEVSPDGRDHFPTVLAKFAEAAARQASLTGELTRIGCPTLVMASDDDIVHLEHVLALYRGLPNAQLAVLPGTSHGLLLERPRLCTRLVAEFLTGDPAPVMPVRRAA
jgi:pimeloyl-ACP methyl ester carboxylesterase